MATAKPVKTFNVQARIFLEVGLEVKADSMELAIETAKKLKLQDFVTIKGDHNDSKYGITGVFENYSFPNF